MMKIDVYFIVIALNSTVIWSWQGRVHIPSPKVNYILAKGGRIWRELFEGACSFSEVRSFNTYGYVFLITYLFILGMHITTLTFCKH